MQNEPASSGLLVLGSPGLGLVSELLRSQRLGLLLVNELHQDALVLEHVTLKEEEEEEKKEG